MKRFYIIVFLFLCLTGCSKEDVIHTLEQNVAQNATNYIQENLVVDAKTEQTISHDFLMHFFSPWNLKQLDAVTDRIKKEQIELISKYKNQPFIGENSHLYPDTWMLEIIKNINFANFPNLKMRGITVQDANIRVLPSIEPAFESWNKPGEGYPFDDLQQSFIAANTPIFVWHISRDGAWYFIMTDSYTGWISKENIAFVNNDFMQVWENYSHVAALHDNIPVFDNYTNFLFKSRIGMIYPVIQRNTFNYQILTAMRDENYFATAKLANIPIKYATEFPLLISTKNVAVLANTILGNYYGWGGMYGYRDCSATLKDLFAPFGIWLPRNSQDQLQESSFIDLSKMSNAEKVKTLLEKGIPFFTLVHLPGHILLYLGKINDDIFVLHNMWGLHTKNIFMQSGRRIVGQTVITPLTFGKQYLDVKQTFLDKIDGARVLIYASFNHSSS